MRKKTSALPPININFSSKISVQISCFLCFLFLYLPIITLVIFSFNDSTRNVIWRGFTWKYYIVALQDADLFLSLLNSLIIALLASLGSVILGTCIAWLFFFFSFPGKRFLRFCVSIPFFLPEICLGVALLGLYSKVPFFQLPWPISLFSLALAHTVFCFPFVVAILGAKLQKFNMEWIHAAKDLGAGEFHILWNVVLPFLAPAMIVSFLLSFILSLDDFLITFFLADPSTKTLPIKIYSMLRFSISPEINCISVFLILITCLLTWLIIKMQKTNKKEQDLFGI